MRGKLDGFSIDRLFRFRNALGRDVETSRSRDRHHQSITQNESIHFFLRNCQIQGSLDG